MSDKISTNSALGIFVGRLNMYICPLLLGSAICYSVTYALYQDYSVHYTVLYFAVQFLLYMLFDRLKKHGSLGGFIYFLMMTAINVISVYLTAIGTRQMNNYMAPLLWFFGSKGYDDDNPIFFNAVFLAGGFFILSVLYYFTQVRFRSLGIMLCILFPFVIYARRSDYMPELMITVIVTLYLLTIVHNSRIDPAAPNRNRTAMKLDLSYVISLLLFVSVTGAVTMMIERPEYLSALERYNLNSDYSMTGSSNSDDLFNTSSERYSDQTYTGRELFIFETNGKNSTYYLRRQPYSDFNGDVWEVDTDNIATHVFYNATNKQYTKENMLDDLAEVIKETKSTLDTPSKEISLLRDGYIYSENYRLSYLPAPIDTVLLNNGRNSRGIWYRNFPLGGIIRTTSDGVSLPLDDSFTFYEQSTELYEYAYDLGLDEASYWALLEKSKSEASARLLQDYINATHYYMGDANISDKVKALAQDITRDCKSDIEKAMELEAYFTEQGYIYDDKYVPKDTSIDYFIFEGKTGVCSSYATAMTLMARSVGLAARYVEGYAAFETMFDEVFYIYDENGIPIEDSAVNTFVIRDSYAHAFVEVYIPGAGWLTFDPTVPDYRNIAEEEEHIDVLAIITSTLSRMIIVIFVLLFILLMWLRDRIIELFFRATQFTRTPKEKTLRLYSNLLRVIGFAESKSFKAYTINMLREHLEEKEKPIPEKLFDIFERTAFAGDEPTEQEYTQAYREYKQCYPKLRLSKTRKRPNKRS